MSRSASAVIHGYAASAAIAFEAELDHVYRTFRRLGAQPAEAEDMAQEVFIVAWRRWHEFDVRRPLRPWLTGIAHHVARGHHRKHSREQATHDLDQEDHRPGPEDQLSSARARDLALRALAMLSEQHRSILIQHDLDGMGVREIAAELSLPFFTASSRLRRARRRFARAVKQLQRNGARPAALLSAEAVLAAERPLPALPASSRARMLARLPPDGPVPSPGETTAPLLPPGRSLPLVPAALALGVLACLVALLAWPRARQTTTVAPGARPVAKLPAEAWRSRRGLAPPRLVPAALTLSPGTAAGEAREPPAALARGLVAHWRFEDGPGSEVARDSSGRGQPCLLHDLDPNTAWVAGPVGGALDLGRKGWLECPLPEARAGVAFDLSVTVWMKRVRPRPFSALFTRQLQGGDSHHLFWFGLRDDLLTVHSDAWLGFTSRTLTTFEGWTHVAFVHAGDETRLYIDGALVRYKSGQFPRGEGLVQSPLTIGSARRRRDPLNVQHHFDGLVDEARVYDRALTDTEIAALAKR